MSSKTLQEREDPINRKAIATLVFGVAGRIGSGTSFVSNGLVEELKAYGYTPVEIKITKEFFVFGEESEIQDEECLSQEAKNIVRLQKKGDELREHFCDNYLAARSIDFIAKHHREQIVFTSQKRFAYIIDSLKHPSEVDLLKTIFRDSFCLIGVIADDSIRKKRLRDQKHISDKAFERISEADNNKKFKYGQHITDTILESDYFFENNYDTPDRINQECKRLLNLLFNSSIITPRQDEYGMHLATMSADKSACLSRQVGSAIITNDGEILATGCNDVPQFGGGLYTSESQKDTRCFSKSLMCHNDDEKRIIADEIIKTLHTEKIDGLTDKHLESIKDILLGKTRLKSLIEFSRAVHAEMDAIISVARSAKPGLIGSTMYVTTYPCHNCAKHIIDAGIERVVFIEPYVKSLAQKLHADEINNPLEEKSATKVSFDNYGGVSPTRYAEWFSMHGERKSNSKLIRKSLKKDILLPLGAQELSSLKSRLSEFSTWLNKVDNSIPIIIFPEESDTN
jgi:deoxycytidylate deaminase